MSSIGFVMQEGGTIYEFGTVAVKKLLKVFVVE